VQLGSIAGFTRGKDQQLFTGGKGGAVGDAPVCRRAFIVGEIPAGEIGRLAAPARAAFLDGMERLNQVLETLLTQMGRSEPAALASSVLAELAGAISDEIGAWEGVVFHVDKDGGYHIEDSDAPNRIRAVWCAPGSDAAWTFETEIPHETFNIYEDGVLYCVGIVFRMEDLK
jgi:hypothetical protein